MNTANRRQLTFRHRLKDVDRGSYQGDIIRWLFVRHSERIIMTKELLNGS
jgi:hypothetical protein